MIKPSIDQQREIIRKTFDFPLSTVECITMHLTKLGFECKTFIGQRAVVNNSITGLSTADFTYEMSPFPGADGKLMSVHYATIRFPQSNQHSNFGDMNDGAKFPSGIKERDRLAIAFKGNHMDDFLANWISLLCVVALLKQGMSKTDAIEFMCPRELNSAEAVARRKNDKIDLG